MLNKKEKTFILERIKLGYTNAPNISIKFGMSCINEKKPLQMK